MKASCQPFASTVRQAQGRHYRMPGEFVQRSRDERSLRVQPFKRHLAVAATGEAEWVTAEFAEALVRSKAVAAMQTNDGGTATPARKQRQSMDVDYLLMKD